MSYSVCALTQAFLLCDSSLLFREHIVAPRLTIVFYCQPFDQLPILLFMTCCAFTENKGIDLSLRDPDPGKKLVYEPPLVLHLTIPSSSWFSKITCFRSQSSLPNYTQGGSFPRLRGPSIRPNGYFKVPTPTITEWQQKISTICSLLRYDLRLKRVSTIRNRHFEMPTVISRTCLRSGRLNYRQIEEIARFVWKPTGRMDWIRKLCNCHFVVIGECRVPQPPIGFGY